MSEHKCANIGTQLAPRYTGPMPPAILSRRLRWLACALLAALLVAALVLKVEERRGMAQEAQTARAELQMRAALITSEIARFRLLPIALADDRDVGAAIAGVASARDPLNRKLEVLAAETGARTIYVLGKDGKAIAASNWRKPQSFVGTDYSSRRYVRDGLACGQAMHFAMGTVSKQPGLYMAQRTAAGGLVVVKLEFDRIEAAWAEADSATFVTDSHGIILVSSRPDWHFALTRPLSPQVFQTFLSEAVLPTMAPRLAPIALHGESAKLKGQSMLAVSLPLAQPAWQITLLRPTRAVITYARTAALLAGVLVLALGLLGWMLHERHSERQQRTQELEQAVADRTADLRREMADHAATEARAADLREGLRQANRLATLGQITASLAHETAQPVAAIRTYAQTSRMLIERGEKAMVEENLTAIARLADRIGMIIAELRGFSRRSPHDGAPVTVGAVLEGTLLILKEQLKAITITLPQDGLEITVAGGKVKLEQVLANLLQNALEALRDRGDPRITLELRASAEAVLLCVIDNGPGIAEDLAARLFTPFATSRPDGLGLGLVIAQDIMTEAGGSLRFRPGENGVGARFDMEMRRA